MVRLPMPVWLSLLILVAMPFVFYRQWLALRAEQAQLQAQGAHRLAKRHVWVRAGHALMYGGPLVLVPMLFGGPLVLVQVGFGITAVGVMVYLGASALPE